MATVSKINVNCSKKEFWHKHRAKASVSGAVVSIIEDMNYGDEVIISSFVDAFGKVVDIKTIRTALGQTKNTVGKVIKTRSINGKIHIFCFN